MVGVYVPGSKFGGAHPETGAVATYYLQPNKETPGLVDLVIETQQSGSPLSGTAQIQVEDNGSVLIRVQETSWLHAEVITTP